MSLLEQTVAGITGQDQAWRAQARARLDQLAIPHWALGRLMDLSLELVGQTRALPPPVARKVIITMAGDHGVAAEGVSKFPQDVTPQMVANFVRGGAGINVLARQAGADVVVVDMGVAADLSALTAGGEVVDKKVAMGTANMAQGPAMSREEAVRAVEAGIELVNELSADYDVFGTGDMGIANTTPSSAIVAALSGRDVAAVTGRGTGLDDRQVAAKIAVINRALEINRPNPADGLDVLSKVGGFEIGGIAGVIIGAAAHHKPVVVDGFISTAGALIAQSLAPMTVEYIIAAHRSMENGHGVMQDHLKCEPLLDLNLRLGEGTGAALAMHLVEAAARIVSEVATFEEAAVAGADK